jgi:LRR receptor-like serine/threonine-protein kinase ERECTA
LEVVLMRNLQVCNLSNSAIGGRMPPLGFLASTLNHLEVIDLSRNNISGLLPPDFGDMLSLQVLDLDQNPFLSGSVPDKVCQLSNITRVRVDCEHLSCGCCNPECD